MKTKDHLVWWESLRNTRLTNGTKDKGYYCDKYFGFGMRLYKHLTNSEIKHIYDHEQNKTN